jgi:hypothetical protein
MSWARRRERIGAWRGRAKNGGTPGRKAGGTGAEGWVGEREVTGLIRLGASQGHGAGDKQS